MTVLLFVGSVLRVLSYLFDLSPSPHCRRLSQAVKIRVQGMSALSFGAASTRKLHKTNGYQPLIARKNVVLPSDHSVTAWSSTQPTSVLIRVPDPSSGNADRSKSTR